MSSSMPSICTIYKPLPGVGKPVGYITPLFTLFIIRETRMAYIPSSDKDNE